MAIPTTYKALLLKIVEQIRTQVPQFEDVGTCFLSLDPDNLPPSPGNFICIVAPMSGNFGQDFFDGGGKETMQASAGFIVKIHSPLMLDEVQREAEFLTNESMGVLDIVDQVLNAVSEWSPVDDGGNSLTRDLISPAGFAFTRSNSRIGAAELTFNLNFDWDVSGAG